MVNKYWLHDFVLGNGLTESMITSQKGSPQAGIGLSGAMGIG